MKTAWIAQFIKFSFVGLVNTVLSYAIYMACCRLLRMSPYIASAIAFVITVFIAYLCQTFFVFRDQKRDRPWWATLIRTYASYSFTGLFLSEALIWIWLDAVKLGNMVGEDAAVAIVPLLNLVVTVPLNFLLNKFWTYGGDSKAKAAKIEGSAQIYEEESSEKD